MSIASEISRISTNISNALTAIAGKGVTVPVDANSDDLATLIGTIHVFNLEEVYPVGSLYATETSTDDPATILGFGTWTKYAPAPLTWEDLQSTEWNNISGVRGNVYVWKRTV